MLFFCDTSSLMLLAHRFVRASKEWKLKTMQCCTLSHVLHESQWLCLRSGIFPVAELHKCSELDAEMLQLFWILDLLINGLCITHFKFSPNCLMFAQVFLWMWLSVYAKATVPLHLLHHVMPLVHSITVAPTKTTVLVWIWIHGFSKLRFSGQSSELSEKLKWATT